MSTMRSFKEKYVYTLVWTSWILILILLSYQARFWINNDTFGSLDSARFFKHFEILKAINAYWGIGYGLLLSFLPLNKTESWLQIHLLISLLLLCTQIFIYKSLLYLDIRKSTATFLSLLWGIINFATGGAFFVTSDVPLCFWGGFYLFWAVKSGVSKKITQPGNAFFLGTLHAVAWLTKTIALPGLMLFPILIFLKEIYEKKSNVTSFKSKFLPSVRFLSFYILPLLIFISCWSIGTTLKYKRISLGDSGAYNYARLIEKSIPFEEAREKAKHYLPPYGTFWWSDISLSMTDWDHKIHTNFSNQLRWVPQNFKLFASRTFSEGGFCIIVILFISFIGLKYAYANKDICSLLIIITLVGYWITVIYASVLLLARYLPFSIIFMMPAVGVAVDQLAISGNRLFKRLVFLILLMGAAYGVAVMTYAALFMAPGGEHFTILKYLQKKNPALETLGPIGAYLGEPSYLHHQGVLAYLLKVQAAEMRPMDKGLSNYAATFTPKTVLLALPRSDKAPMKVVVNDRVYNKMFSINWGKAYKMTQLIIYQPVHEGGF